jgi:hypothetical protein
VHGDHRGEHLSRQLHGRREVEAIVKRPNERDHGRGQKHSVPQLVVSAIAGRQPHERRDEQPGEDREAAQQRRRTFGQAPLARLVDRANGPREPHRERRHQRGDDRGSQEGVKRVELVGMRHRLAHSIAGAEVASAAGRPLGRRRARERLVERVAIDERGDALGQLAGSRFVLGQERAREYPPDLAEVVALQAARREGRRADAQP